MVMSLKQKWKYSSIRFYVLNALWNYKFWIFAKRIYKQVSYTKKTHLNLKGETILKKRFYGYNYKGIIYLDNPGLHNIERDVWEVWKNKGLI